MAQDPEQPIPQDVAYKSRLVDVLYEDPKTRPALLRLVKQYAPNVRIPELDTEQTVLTALQPIAEELKADRAERQRDREERAQERMSQRLLARGDLTDAELPDVARIAAERGITNLDTAADFYTQVVRPAAVPRGQGPSPFTMPGGPDMKGLYDNPKQWARAEAYKLWNELRPAGR